MPVFKETWAEHPALVGVVQVSGVFASTSGANEATQKSKIWQWLKRVFTPKVDDDGFGGSCCETARMEATKYCQSQGMTLRLEEWGCTYTSTNECRSAPNPPPCTNMTRNPDTGEWGPGLAW